MPYKKILKKIRCTSYVHLSTHMVLALLLPLAHPCTEGVLKTLCMYGWRPFSFSDVLKEYILKQLGPKSELEHPTFWYYTFQQVNKVSCNKTKTKKIEFTLSNLVILVTFATYRCLVERAN